MNSLVKWIKNEASPIKETLNKVAEVTIFFWIIKILCTTVGETAADFLNESFNLGLTGTTIVMGILLVIILFFQFREKKYVPSLYWLAVVLISIFGTLITDNITDNFGVSLITTTIIFSIILAIVFAVWYRVEATLSIHTISNMRREGFYWLAILFTFALGTAAGDLMAETFGLGYFVSALLFAFMILAVAVAYFKFKLNAVLAFWIAYILTRPLGASIGDFLSQPTDSGGLGLGSELTSIIFLIIILVTVIYLTTTEKNSVAKSEEALG